MEQIIIYAGREATGKSGRRWRETPGADRWAGGPPLIRAVPAPKSLRAVLYDPSAPVKVGNMDDWYSPRDLACAVRQTTRQLEQSLHQHLQLAENVLTQMSLPFPMARNSPSEGGVG